jgi:cytochrome c553
MKDYQSGRRQNDTMKGAVASLSDADMNHIALFFALQKPARAQTSAEGDAAMGKAAAAGCAGCHGDRGISGNPAIPRLAGQDATYLIQALQSYKTSKRGDETMIGVASPLDGRRHEKRRGLSRLVTRPPNPSRSKSAGR